MFLNSDHLTVPCLTVVDYVACYLRDVKSVPGHSH